MGIPVEIVSIGQQLDVDTGKSFNTLVFRLSTGQIFDSMVSDEVVAAVTQLIGQGLASRQPFVPSHQRVESSQDQPQPSPEMSSFGSRSSYEAAPGTAEMTSVFGEQPSESQVKVSDFPVQPAQRPPQSPQATMGILSEPPERLQVGKNEMGYPVVRGGNRQDPGEVVGNGERDEDGVASL